MSEEGVPTGRLWRQAEKGVVRCGGRRFCLHRYGYVDGVGAWLYYKCRWCDRRRAHRTFTFDGPLDWDWLLGVSDGLPTLFGLGKRNPRPGGLPAPGE